MEKCDFRDLAQSCGGHVRKKAARPYGLAFVPDHGPKSFTEILQFLKPNFVWKSAGLEVPGCLLSKMTPLRLTLSMLTLTGKAGLATRLPLTKTRP